ncbi:MAG: hypothetical protein HFH91_04430 [Lachnospiraceae bacterium]|nr:hypothetical protein [Lachnospiraceae bacterium]
MYSYSITQWMFFFYFYCFAGWCVESAYVSIEKRKLTNRGFLRGPFLPLYGSGGIMMLVVSMPFRDNLVLTYLAGCVGATVLEYVTGVIMEALFKVRYWDYSNQPLNFQGRICLGTTLGWGLLTILMTQIIHVPVERFVLSIPEQALKISTIIFTSCFLVDFALSFKAAIDLRNVLIMMEQVKKEMVRIQKRLDAIIAQAGQGMGNYKASLTESMSTAKEEWSGSMAELKASVETKLESLKKIILTKPAGHLENFREELLELKTKYAVNLAFRNRLGRLRDFFQRDMIRSNPGMTSTRFREALEELQCRVQEKRCEEDCEGTLEEETAEETLGEKLAEEIPDEE